MTAVVPKHVAMAMAAMQKESPSVRLSVWPADVID